MRGRISNDNGSVIRMLSKKTGAYNKGRNRLLFGAVFLSVVALAVIFGLAYGRMESEYQKAVRTAGMTASAFIRDADEDQYERAGALGYVTQLGRRVTAGTAAKEGSQGTAPAACTLQWLDTAAWKEIVSPAYTEIHGTYPKKSQEIMLSKRALQALGIQSPRKGMEISLDVSLGLFRREQATFTLCGWFRDYGEGSKSSAPAYISGKKLEEWGYDYQEEADVLLCISGNLGWQRAEKLLYDDIPMKDINQQIVITDSAVYETVRGMAGGVLMAAAAAVIILCGIFFLVYNVMQISLLEDVRQMGLLHLVGATDRQIRRIYYGQIIRVLVPGVLLGALVSLAILRVFRPRLLAVAILLTVLITLGSAFGVIWHVVNRCCMENVGDTGLKMGRTKEKRKKQGRMPQILLMAWRNVTRYRARFVLTSLSLFLGVEALLGVAVISGGSDYANAVGKRPDFLIAGQFSRWGREEGHGTEFKTRDAGEDPLETEGSTFELIYDNAYDEFSPISREVRERLWEIPGIDRDSSSVTEGAYLYPVISKKGIRPLTDDGYENPPGSGMIEDWGADVVQILTEEELKELETYVEEKGLPVDMKAVKEGTGVLILHDHVLSRQQEEMTKESVGEPMYFLTLPEKDGTTGQKQSKGFTLGGYLDSQAEDFPKLHRTWHGGEGSIQCLVSSQGFERIPTQRKTLVMELNLEDQSMEAEAADEISQVVADENERRSQITGAGTEEGTSEAGIFCISKSDLVKKAQKEIRAGRMIFGSISAVLLCAGLTNFLNVMAAGILSHRKELEILGCIGMTEKQMRRMLMAEGGCYCILVAGFLLTVGNGVLAWIHFYMEQHLSYFVYRYPAGWTVMLLGGLLLICMAVPGILLKEKTSREKLLLRI